VTTRAAARPDATPSPLPRDGWLLVVKRECETCAMIAPLVPGLVAALGRDGAAVVVASQDDPAFPPGVAVRDDAELATSWNADVDTVPALLRYRDGRETGRALGWSRDEWRALTGVADLGGTLPPHRPGCGSRSVDPDRVDALRARHGGDVLRARRIELADAEDEHEALFARGVTDGLPVVPPTPERVLRMLAGTSRRPDEVVAVVPPDLVECTVEKVAINAVMAGCRPEHLEWVIAALRAACTDEFNMHGVLCTTMPVGPVIVCNGPGTAAAGLNSGINALGQGTRANMAIGRALQLVVRNVGGGRPGEVDRATHGHPGKVGFCFAEDEARSPFGSLAVARGAPAGADAVTVFAGEGPRCVVDQLARTPEALATTLAHALRAVHHPKLVVAFDALLVVGPEHARVFADAGWDRTRLLDELHARLAIPGTELVRGAGGMAEGVREGLAGATLPKFRPGGILLAHAGGDAGLFSAIIGGWANGAMGSEPVTRRVGA
jgi:hypothetical protein